MEIIVFSEHDVETMLPVEACVGVMEEVLARLAGGRMHQPLRSLVRAEGPEGFLGLMPAYDGGADEEAATYWGLKEVCVYPGNPERGLDSHLGAVLLHDGRDGRLLAVADASAITAIRTAAVSAVATRLLAREDAADLAIVGTGVQARAHLRAIAAVRSIRRVRVAGRTPEKAKAMVDEIAGWLDATIEPCHDVEAAVRDADIVVTATSSREPVIRREWIADGAHLNLVGSSVRTAREADGATMAAGHLFVDRRESTVNESGDYLLAIEEGAIGPDAIRAEIGEILIGHHPGRTDPAEITIFKSLGLAVQDIAAAAALYEQAMRTGGGTRVPFA